MLPAMRNLFALLGTLALGLAVLIVVTSGTGNADPMLRATEAGATALIGIGFMIGAVAYRPGQPRPMTAMPGWQAQPPSSPGAPPGHPQPFAHPQPPAPSGPSPAGQGPR
jgi:hypothetical protein